MLYALNTEVAEVLSS